MWGLMHFFFMTLLPSVECPYVAALDEPVRYKIHDPIHVERPILQMYHRKGVQRNRYPRLTGNFGIKLSFRN